MCVDDDEVTRRLLERLLKNSGFDAITAKSGIDALAKVNKKSPISSCSTL